MTDSRTILRLSAGEHLDIQESCCSSLQSAGTWYMCKWIPFPAGFSSNCFWLYASNTCKYHFYISLWVWLSWLLITQAHNVCELLRDEEIPYTQTLWFPNTKNTLKLGAYCKDLWKAFYKQNYKQNKQEEKKLGQNTTITTNKKPNKHPIHNEESCRRN